MSKEVSLAEFEGPLTELRQQCSGQNGRSRFEEFKLWLKKVPGLLRSVRTVAVKSVEKFVVAEYLGQEGVNKDDVKIAFLGNNFKTKILPLIESGTPQSKLQVSRLTRWAKALDIASALPENVWITTPGQMYQLVKAQKNGQEGPLLVNGWANLFLMYGNDGNVWLVGARWDGGGWDFYAGPLGGPHGWGGGNRRVFSQVG